MPSSSAHADAAAVDASDSGATVVDRVPLERARLRRFDMVRGVAAAPFSAAELCATAAECGIADAQLLLLETRAADTTEFPAYRADDLCLKLVAVALAQSSDASDALNALTADAGGERRIVASAAIELALPAAATVADLRRAARQALGGGDGSDSANGDANCTVRLAHIVVDQIIALDDDAVALSVGGGNGGSSNAAQKVASLKLVSGDTIHAELSAAAGPSLIAQYFDRLHHSITVHFNHPDEAALVVGPAHSAVSSDAPIATASSDSVAVPVAAPRSAPRSVIIDKRSSLDALRAAMAAALGVDANAFKIRRAPNDRELKDGAALLSFYGIVGDVNGGSSSDASAATSGSAESTVFLQRGTPLTATQTIFRILLHVDEADNAEASAAASASVSAASCLACADASAVDEFDGFVFLGDLVLDVTWSLAEVKDELARAFGSKVRLRHSKD
jgi:hypothetical protein